MSFNKLHAILISARPKQWLKNFFVLAALVFAKEFFSWHSIGLASLAFLLFCLSSSAIYMVNDVSDLASDRAHPSKMFRPLPAGRISTAVLLITAGLLILAALTLAVLALNKFFTLTLASYILLNLVYSFWLKRLLFVDILSIASSFVLRVIAGALAINVVFSVWLILCTFFLTLFLAIGKRKSEIILVDSVSPKIAAYSAPLLDQMNMVVLPSTLIAYAFYTFSSPHSQWLMVTIPPVVYGLFRYLFIVSSKTALNNGPSDDLLADRPLQLTLLVWAAVTIFILLYAR